MPKPKKIRKKKSFMFTTKHQSENGILSASIAILSTGVLIGSIVFAFLHRGNVPKEMGAVGMFAALADIIGIIAAALSFKERDIFIWVPRIALIVNAVLLILWVLLVMAGMFFGA